MNSISLFDPKANMGTFQGHLLPGVSFLVLGLLWTVNIIRRALMCRKKDIPFYNTVTYPLPMHGRCVKWPLEAGIKITLTAIAMGAELFAATNYGQAGKVVYIGDLQHVTMYAFFCISGIIDVLHSYKKTIAGLDHAALTMAFLVEGLLFMYHLHGNDALNRLVHTLLIYAIFACAVFSSIEIVVKESMLLALARAFAVILQGTWFILVGFILFPPVSLGLHRWKEGDEDQLTKVAILFSWNIVGVFILMCVVSGISHFLHVKVCPPSGEDYIYETLDSEDEDEDEDEDKDEDVEESTDNRSIDIEV